MNLTNPDDLDAEQELGSAAVWTLAGFAVVVFWGGVAALWWLW